MSEIPLSSLEIEVYLNCEKIFNNWRKQHTYKQQ